MFTYDMCQTEKLLLIAAYITDLICTDSTPVKSEKDKHKGTRSPLPSSDSITLNLKLRFVLDTRRWFS